MTDPTPETPFTVRDRIVAALATLMGEDARDLTAAFDQLFAIQSQAYYIGQLMPDIQERLDRIQEGIGATPYNSITLTTTRGYLAAILRALTSQTEGIPPSTNISDVVSVSSIVDEGRRYAQFGDIAGVEEAEGGINLTPTVSWSGWRAYIQTPDPSPRVVNQSVASNSWLTLTGSDTINFSVETTYQIRVFLRPPLEGVDDYDEISSQLVTYTGGIVLTDNTIVWPSKYNGVNSVSGWSFTASAPMLTRAVGGYNISLQTGIRAYVWRQIGNTASLVAMLTPGGTTNISIPMLASDEYVKVGADNNTGAYAFTIRVTPSL